MELITQRDLIRDVANDWRYRYCHLYKSNPKYKDVGKELTKLDLETVNAVVIDSIIGNDSWTTITCDSCRNQVRRCVVIEQDEDAFYICADCLATANEMINS